MAENENLNNNKFDKFNSIQSTSEFINRSTTFSNNINYTNTSSGTASTTGLSERDATHFRLRDGVTEGFEYLTCLSCGESFKSSSLIEVYDHYRERPHLRQYANCLYCKGKVHQYYSNRQQSVQFYHNCLRWKRGEDK